jgi:hypothetical protein
VHVVDISNPRFEHQMESITYLQLVTGRSGRAKRNPTFFDGITTSNILAFKRRVSQKRSTRPTGCCRVREGPGNAYIKRYSDLPYKCGFVDALVGIIVSDFTLDYRTLPRWPLIFQEMDRR